MEIIALKDHPVVNDADDPGILARTSEFLSKGPEKILPGSTISVGSTSSNDCNKTIKIYILKFE